MDPPADQTAGKIYGNRNQEIWGRKEFVDAVWGYCVRKTP